MDWMLIDSAPRDGTQILTFKKGRKMICISAYQDGTKYMRKNPGWSGWSTSYTKSTEPTHWMPIPEPPDDK